MRHAAALQIRSPSGDGRQALDDLRTERASIDNSWKKVPIFQKSAKIIAFLITRPNTNRRKPQLRDAFCGAGRVRSSRVA